MLFPVRCWTCGKIIGHLWDEFNERLRMAKISNDNLENGLESLFQRMGLKRFCCHTMFLSHYETYEEAIKMGFPEDYSNIT
ncbi:RNA polymerase-like protein [Euroglyphus maynei]|uniref:DNA-directed RNA polymerases I, II, and III subunit RPABC5 n=1 Tax=Euroglyphus maynei TaxID=6958 RepID=A0A1Y3ANC6_EURMA|nr:RNA polymerase-like protein [Euroglyphus maynei]